MIVESHLDSVIEKLKKKGESERIKRLREEGRETKGQRDKKKKSICSGNVFDCLKSAS